MKCYQLTVGARNRVKSAAAFDARDDETIQKITARYFPNGSTILKSNGTWFDASVNKFVVEESRQILVCANDIKELKSWYNDLIYALQQKAAMLVELGPVNFILSDPVKIAAMEHGIKVSAAKRHSPTTSITK